MRKNLQSRAAKVVRAKFGSLSRAAETLTVSRAHLSEALKDAPTRGSQVRRKLAEALTAEELAAAGWNDRGEIVSGELRVVNED